MFTVVLRISPQILRFWNCFQKQKQKQTTTGLWAQHLGWPLEPALWSGLTLAFLWLWAGRDLTCSSLEPLEGVSFLLNLCSSLCNCEEPTQAGDSLGPGGDTFLTLHDSSTFLNASKLAVLWPSLLSLMKTGEVEGLADRVVGEGRHRSKKKTKWSLCQYSAERVLEGGATLWGHLDSVCIASSILRPCPLYLSLCPGLYTLIHTLCVPSFCPHDRSLQCHSRGGVSLIRQRK